MSVQLEVTVRNKSDAFVARCYGSTASCTSSAIEAARRAAAKHTRKMASLGTLVRPATSNELTLRRGGITATGTFLVEVPSSLVAETQRMERSRR